MNFHGERRSNATHASTTDPEARLSRKSQGHEAKLAYQGHVLMENRHGLVVDTCVTQATGIAERETAVAMATNLRPGATVGADKGYDTRGFVAALRTLGLTPHVAQNTTRRASAIDGRTTRHAGYAVSQQKRKRVEEVFGWVKTVALLRKTRHRGVRRVGWLFTLAAALYNLVRIRNVIEPRRPDERSDRRPDGPRDPPGWTRRPASACRCRLERRPFTRQPPIFRSLLVLLC